MLTAIMVCIVGVLVYTLYSRRKFYNIPTPGLYIPFFGHYKIFLGADPIEHFQQLYKTYSRNNIMMMTILGLNNVLVGDISTLKYLYNHPDVQNRDHDNYQHGLFTKKVSEDRGIPPGPMVGVVMSQGRIWTEQRRFALRTLRDFGFGKESMEQVINNEVKQFCQYLRQFTQEPIDMAGKFNLPVLNAIWGIMMGERFDYDDTLLQDIIHRFTKFMEKLGNPSTLLAVTHPWIFSLFPKFLGRNEDIQINRDMQNLIRGKVENHRSTVDYSDPRDFIDAGLIEVNSTKDPESSFFGERGVENLTNTVLDLFMAGSETTSTTLTWAFLYMAREPEVQRKVQEEISHVVGDSRLPTLADKESMVYTEAVLREVLRCGNIVPNGVHHSSSKDITVNGITIPANTFISPLMVEILKGDHWGADAAVFNPDRFIDKDGKLQKDESFIPFSIGRRQCLGETLARSELFLFFAGLLQHFAILPEIDGEIPAEANKNGVTNLPKNFKVRLQLRL